MGGNYEENETICSIGCCIRAVSTGGGLLGCDNSGSSGGDISYISDDAYAPGFYPTQYTVEKVRDVFRNPSTPSEDEPYLEVYNPRNPCLPDNGGRYTDEELGKVAYIVLKASETEEDLYDEYAVSKDRIEKRIGTSGKITCFAKEGFLYLCGGSSGEYYGTFFFTGYGYKKFTETERLSYKYDRLRLGHNDVTEIFGAVD